MSATIGLNVSVHKVFEHEVTTAILLAMNEDATIGTEANPLVLGGVGFWVDAYGLCWSHSVAVWDSEQVSTDLTRILKGGSCHGHH